MMYDDLTITVIGDIMLDHWREGTEYKLNPESPTIDIQNPTSEYTLGGAGNVARIVRGLGAKVYLVGVLGTSFGPAVSCENEQFSFLCERSGITPLIVFEENRKTTVKERIVCDGQQICRISEEDTRWIKDETVDKLLHHLTGVVEHGCGKTDGIIIADYSKGVMNDQLIHAVMLVAKENDIPVLVDPKDRLYIYKGCAIMKPNHKEYEALVDPGQSDIGFFEKMQCRHLVITSPKTINWYSDDMTKGHVHSHSVEVANVSGAGDAVAAVLLMEYIRNGRDIEGAVKLANWGASMVVQQERTGHLTIPDLMPFLSRHNRLDGAKCN